VAVSGGADSTALLHACAAVVPAARLVACHVHHGLQAAADGFADHCAVLAHTLGVRFDLQRIEARPGRGESVEAWAREHRYRVLAACAQATGALAVLTAHHADDQAETLLIGLSRGSGPEGLSGMRAASDRNGVRLMRPFLALSRACLRGYCARHALAVVDDPMNDDPTLLRSALRRQVMPALVSVAPGFVANAARSAGLLAEAAELAREWAQVDLARAVDAVGGLRLSALATLSRARKANALRQWLRERGAPVPSQARLAALLEQAFGSVSAHALWGHAGWCVVRYRDSLQALSPQALWRPDRPGPADWQGCWSGEQVVRVPKWGLEMRVSSAAHVGAGFVVDRALLARGPVVLRAPSARLRVRPGPKSRSREVRKRWQELGVPPWLRGWLPELRVGEVTLGVVGLGAAAAHAAPVMAAFAEPCEPGVLESPPPVANAEADVVTLSLHLTTPEDPRGSWVMPYN
jgi:tRNA(Ile)-lysidine synthase